MSDDAAQVRAGSRHVGTRPYDDCCGDCGERGIYCCDGGWHTRAGAEVERLREAMERAHTQLSKHDYKGPKQIGRALMTMERALGIYEEPS